MITKSQFIKLFPSAKDPDEWVKALEELLPQYEVNTKNRIAAFLSNVHHESAGLTALSENLNYSSAGLQKTFKKYFPTVELADAYARQPQKIASRVYANRMGNSDEASQEGWKYRGRGILQITGKDNYTKFAEAMVTEPIYVLENPHIVSDYPFFSALTGFYFWNKNKLNEIADSGDMVLLTKRINGGKLGLEERIKLFEQVMEILS